MAVLPILTADNPILRRKSKRVGRLDKSLRRLIDDMIETMHAAPGIGLAAVQVGVPLRIIVIELPKGIEDPMAGQLIVLCNPEIVKRSGEWQPEEGCLSVPGYVANVKRSLNVTVKGRDLHGKEVRFKATSLLAQTFQHEIDHTNGILFFDYLTSLDELRPIQRQAETETATGAI
jgi:peptide deformylase